MKTKLSKNKICKVEGCGCIIMAKGLCNKHYLRQKYHGTTDKPKKLRERLLEEGKSYCAGCKTIKTIDNFTEDKDRVFGMLSPYCKDCKSTNGKLEYKRNRKRYINKELTKKFGISFEEYNEILKYQNNCCAICGKPCEENKKMLSVDHDHKTNKIRGILCDLCNRGLGVFRDDTTILNKAIKYLESPPVSKMSKA
jgi:hypothetical protein